MLSLLRVTGAHDDFQCLTRLLDADLDARYGALQAAYNPYNASAALDTVVTAYVDQIPVGCGAFKPYDAATVEIKRMFVRPEYRGQGIAGRILAELEAWARELGYTAAILETGRKQAEAIGLYTKRGYRPIENYGQYRGMSNSVCLRQELG